MAKQETGKNIDIFLFAGTSEGRQIADFLRTTSRKTIVFTATEYGKSLIEESGSLKVEDGRLDAEEMAQRFSDTVSSDAGPSEVGSSEAGSSDAGPTEVGSSEAGSSDTGPSEAEKKLRFPLVIDATHPYASLVTENIKEACKRTGLSYLRVLRSSTYKQNLEDVIVSSPEEAAQYLSGTKGNVLLTTGSKELKFFTAVPDYRERLYARVLSLPKVVSECADLGFTGRHLICMQGPFSEEMNIALIHTTGALYLVTKDTGLAGGFEEKESAARKCGCRLVVIGRPSGNKEGIGVEEAICLLKEQML
ncbi:MAG: precorrin-6A/cobalt-precorrin-6A reductase [Eubacterium sp.]|nr:precorrin-6A/cobalt-precorrin-6A reductase [Eubacterium sp.]